MNVLEIIASSKDRSEAIQRLTAAGVPRQEAKALTFHMMMYTFGMRAVGAVKP